MYGKMWMKKMLNEGNQIHNVISSSGSGTVTGSGSDFLTSYGSGSGFTSQKVTVPTVPVPQRCLAVLDPYWECESGSRNMEIVQNLLVNLVFLPFKKGFCIFVGMFYDLFPALSNYFSCKNVTFCYFKFWLGSGSAWIRNALAFWTRIWIRIEIKSWIRIRNATFAESQCWTV